MIDYKVDNKIGKFYASTELVSSGKIFPVLVLMKFVPLRVECIWHKDMFEYIGISYLFSPVKLGTETPEYIIRITTEEHERIKVTVKPMNKEYTETSVLNIIEKFNKEFKENE